MIQPILRLGAAAALSFAALGALPAAADPAADVCRAAPEALRPLAAAAEPAAQRKALRNIALGEALCEARNRSEANRKFTAAARDLGTDLQLALAHRGPAAAQ